MTDGSPGIEVAETAPASAAPFQERLRALLARLVAAAAARARAETESAQRAETDGAATEREHAEALAAHRRRTLAERSEMEEAHARRIALVEEANHRERATAERASTDERKHILAKAGANEAEARKQLEEAIWVAETVYEAGETQPADRQRQAEKVIDARRADLESIAEQALTIIRKNRMRPAPAPAPAEGAPPVAEDPLDALHGRAQEAALALERLRRLRLPRLFRGYVLHLVVLLTIAGTVAVMLWQRSWQVDRVLAFGALGAAAVLALIVAGLRIAARRRTVTVHGPLRAVVDEGLRLGDAARDWAAERRRREEEEGRARRDRELRTAREKYEPIIRQIGERRDHHLQRIEVEHPRLLEEIVARGEEELRSAEAQHAAQVAEAAQAQAEAADSIERRYDERMRRRDEERDRSWRALERRWKEEMAACGAAARGILAEDARLFPAWDDPSWSAWAPPRTFAPSIRFGHLLVDRATIPGGMPADPRLQVELPPSLALPATLDFPDRCSLLLLTDGGGRDEALATLRTVMLRLLVSLPPGKVRFTIVDPVGLGENFAGFMHLGDYEDAFVSSRIWTETRHIEQRLADLTEHMETVIQKYLRNEFATIADYNEQAGEIAEPYRFLVIADLPAKFSDAAAQRLASIVNSGARCGVHTLIMADRRQAMPASIDLAELEARATVLEWIDTTCRWKDPDFAAWPLRREEPPDDAFLTRLLHAVGEASKDATRVEVPFAAVAPAPAAIWSRRCDRTLAVPLGRCGATKLQSLEIGAGTSQHVLIAGKTGSGKSTLLHVLVTNLALWYSPDEVEFYLVDFKKGVEFKTYANHAVPHVRAVAIESDREFGLSVLRRLDAELKARGDRFRGLGVQDLAGYRRLDGVPPLPRTLLIVDEFQELFVEDDKIGQDAALLLDRLVRQGRAFGVHVILGSQTLGGAYTLARSTIGQMQVRIALQCGEADSYLILSEDNAAARLLERPGEAIYNDAGGRIEGNSPFQIVWLPDEERDERLAAVARTAQERGFRAPAPVIFEGNVPARIDGNAPLAALLSSGTWPGAVAPPHAWLGESVAIKGPTAAVLRRQSGNNLLIVGQQEEPALAMTCTAIASLAAHRRPAAGIGAAPGGADAAIFYLLDGTPVDSPHAGYLRGAARRLPHGVRIVEWREVEGAIAEIAAELARRQVAGAADAPLIFLAIFGLHRFRMLRTTDEFGFAPLTDDAKPACDKQFAAIVREGAPLGIHTLTWCDTAANLTRTLERSGLREFEMRVLFQMSGADSTQLIDAPSAAKLGTNRALFYNEEEGVLEKFRPYALPEAAWLDEVAARLAEKT
jgi:hypothetical protein